MFFLSDIMPHLVWQNAFFCFVFPPLSLFLCLRCLCWPVSAVVEEFDSSIHFLLMTSCLQQWTHTETLQRWSIGDNGQQFLLGRMCRWAQLIEFTMDAVKRGIISYTECVLSACLFMWISVFVSVQDSAALQNDWRSIYCIQYIVTTRLVIARENN